MGVKWGVNDEQCIILQSYMEESRIDLELISGSPMVGNSTCKDVHNITLICSYLEEVFKALQLFSTISIIAIRDCGSRDGTPSSTHQ